MIFLIFEATQETDYRINQSGEETETSNHTVSIPITDVLDAALSCHDLTSNTRTVMDSAAHEDTIKVECTSDIDASLTSDAEYSATTDDDVDEPGDYDNDLDESEPQELQMKLPNDLQIENDNTSTTSPPNQEQDGLLTGVTQRLPTPVVTTREAKISVNIVNLPPGLKRK